MITRKFGLRLSALFCAGMTFAALSGPSARAQFGQIFGAPPRPPANVPNRPPAPPPLGLPEQMPPEEMDEDVPQTPTARATPPQLAPRPQPGAVRSQPLAPPPGAAVAPSGPPPNAGGRPVQPGMPSQAAVPPPAQQQVPGASPPGNPPPASTAPQPGDEIVTEMPSQKIANPTAVFAGLDKITGRIISFEVPLNDKVQFGALQVTPRVCYTRPPTETANTDSFVQVDEVTLQGEVKRIFSGWMFANSPGLHAVEHPIYDVWLTDCKGGTTVITDAQPGAANSSSQGQPPAQSPPQRSGTASRDTPARPPATSRPPTQAPAQNPQQVAPMQPPNFAAPPRR